MCVACVLQQEKSEEIKKQTLSTIKMMYRQALEDYEVGLVKL